MLGEAAGRLKNNIARPSFKLNDENDFEIDDSEQFDLGFPTHFMFETATQKYHVGMSARDIREFTCNARLETVPKPQVSYYIQTAFYADLY